LSYKHSGESRIRTCMRDRSLLRRPIIGFSL